MLEDRDYMREPDYRSGSMSMTKLLTIVLVVVFAFQCINDVYLHTGFERWMALTPEGVRHGWVWQLITFQFLHGNLGHIVGNLIGFWFLGQFVEGALGRKRFLIALFGCGAVGGILQSVLMLVFPSAFGFSVVGASAGVSGLLAIFALLQKDSEILFNFIFRIKAMTLLWVWGGIALFFTVVPSFRNGGVANAAHLGGILAGIAWVKLGWHHDYVQLPWEGWLERIKNRRQNQAARPKRPAFNDEPFKSPGAITPGVDEPLREDVDPILDKISAQGIQSLTARERAILESARKRMSRK